MTSTPPLYSPTNREVLEEHRTLACSQLILWMTSNSLPPWREHWRRVTVRWESRARILRVWVARRMGSEQWYLLRELPSYVMSIADSGQRCTSDLDTVIRCPSLYSMIELISSPFVFFLASSSPQGISHKYTTPCALPPIRKCPSLLTSSTDMRSSKLTRDSGCRLSDPHTLRKVLPACWANICWAGGQQAKVCTWLSSRNLCNTAVVLGSKRKTSLFSEARTSRASLEERIIFNFIIMGLRLCLGEWGGTAMV